VNTEQLLKLRQKNNEDYNLIGDGTDQAKEVMTTKFEIVEKVREKLLEKYSIQEINNRKLFESMKKVTWEIIEEEIAKDDLLYYLDSYEKADIFEILVQKMFGYGIIDPLISDNSITEIMVNELDKIFVEKNGLIQRVFNKQGKPLAFNNKDELFHVIEKIVAPINRKVDESNPIVDARLPNGFRVNIVLNPISLDGSVITIRKFPENPYTMNDLVKFNTLPNNVAHFLSVMVEAKYNIIVSGGTGTGKTTFLNALSNYIKGNTRIITIEDAAELKLKGLNNLIRLETRAPNIEGKGAITMRDLVKSALRMRPDRIIVGEVRGGEALDMLQAMNTGHDGSLSTGHANSASDMLSRLETMVLMAGVELPLASIRQQIASAVDILVHLSKMHDGSRRVVQITEITGLKDNEYVLNDLFKFEFNDSKSLGYLKHTNATIHNTDKLMFYSSAKNNNKGDN